MEKEKINGGSAVRVQGLVCSFGVIYISFIFYFVLHKKLEHDALYFLGILVLITALAMWYSLSNSDIYISGESVILQKLFTSKTVPVSQVESINHTLFPFFYFIKFKDGKKVYFQLKLWNLMATFLNSEDVLNNIKAKFHLDSKD